MKRRYTLLFLDSYSDCDHNPGYFVLILIRISIRVRLKQENQDSFEKSGINQERKHTVRPANMERLQS